MAREEVPAQASDGNGQSLLRVDRIGPAGGGCLSMIGAVLVMIGFLLPWASCAGTTANGLQLATSSEVPSRSAVLLLLVPCIAIGLLGIGLTMLPLSARERLRQGWFSLRAAGGLVLAV